MRIIGYTYRAETLCRACVIDALPTGEGEQFDGWNDATGSMSTEDNLSEIALAFGIDRMDESTYDSDDFPKVIYSSMLDGIEQCSTCANVL